MTALRWALLALSPVWIAAELISPQDQMSRGRAAFERGALVEAVDHWRKAFEVADPKLQVEALVYLGAAYQALGQTRSAIATLEQAVALAEKLQDRQALLLAKSGLGAACTCNRQADWAEKNLREALALAAELDDHATAAAIWTNLGNLLAARGRVDEALAAFQNAGTAKAFANAAAVAVQAELNEKALAACENLPASHELAMVLIRCGQTDEKLRQPQRAEQSYRRALAVAEELNDTRASTYALGWLGHLRELSGDLTGALELTRQAAFLAQQAGMPEALYRWDWQTGRILRAQHDHTGALAAYRRAAQTLRPIRSDLAQGCGASRPSYRETIAPLYYEYADLLLAGDQLVAARDIIEQLKSGELEDYLQDECAGSSRGSARLESIAKTTAVIYIIPLADRTELLVGFHDGLQRFRLPVTAEQLTATVRQFRLNLEKRTTNQYLVQARQLYQALIVPLQETLAARRIETLVFVPDGALRTIPLGALEDGDRFLVERFAVAVTPGLTLMDAQPMARGKMEALAGGVAEGVQHFAPLPHVAEELRMVQSVLHSPLLLDRQFVQAELQRDFESHQFQIVHFATHGEFDKDISRSFLLTYDGRLSFDDLEVLLRPGQFRGKPIELLTLSACQTAAGDDRAALGLAGVAVKAGARSALATLWFVHDESSALLMSEFYTRLRAEAGASKAEALRQAQIKVLRDPRFGHPAYWAAYILVGNWL